MEMKVIVMEDDDYEMNNKCVDYDVVFSITFHTTPNQESNTFLHISSNEGLSCAS